MFQVKLEMENGEVVIHFNLSFTPVICLIWEENMLHVLY